MNYQFIFQNVVANAHSIHTRQASPRSSGTFFSLFHKHRHASVSSPSKEAKSSEKSIQNKHSENILNKIRMSSLASVASSMNIPSKRKGELSGTRNQRRSGRRNDKFLSLWGSRSTTKKVNKTISSLCNIFSKVIIEYCLIK